MDYCFNCMNKLDGNKKCVECGYVHSDITPPHRLKPGTILNDRYLIGNALGEGGFGITYVGLDKRLEIKVAIKEFFPSGFVTRFIEDSLTVEPSNENNSNFFKKGKDEFLREARTLALFSNENGIVDVRDFFDQNGTAYIVMGFIDGKNLKTYMREYGVFNYKVILNLIKPIIESLEKIHKTGLIHRDISPDNIMFTKTSSLKLMDFGAAANFDNGNKSRGAIILKPGYAPIEQYKNDGNQGPWTDIYALCATLYKCVTGITPDDAISRNDNDNLKPPSILGLSIPKSIEDAIMAGLEIDYTNRIKNATELMSRLYKDKTILVFDDEENNSDLYIDDNIETAVINENYIDYGKSFTNDSEETTLLDEETSLLSEETTVLEETSVLNENNPNCNQNNFVNSSRNQNKNNQDVDEEDKDYNVNDKGKIKSNFKIIFSIIVGIIGVALIAGGIFFVVNKSDNNDSNKTDTYIISNGDNSKEDDDVNVEETEEAKEDLPSVVLNGYSSKVFDVDDISISKYEDSNYRIDFDINYSTSYGYHSEILYDSDGNEVEWISNDGYLHSVGEDGFVFSADMPKGSYTYEISLFDDNEEIGKGTIDFSIE